MSLRNRIRSQRNAFDFALRSRITFGLKVEEVLPQDLQFQKEMDSFLALFDWKGALQVHAGKSLKVLDVGARNFNLAPVFDSLFQEQGFLPEIHGIEIDAYRRLSNLRTRKDYADYFISKSSNAQFHACDFLKWETPADCVFALNPFVTEKPVLAWGLPLTLYKPEAFFEKAAQLLKAQCGHLFVTNPTEIEVAKTKEILKGNFQILEQHSWTSPSGGRPRIGGLYRRV